ncbi:MAG: long-chain fatty acid--CoA ligase, partial [Merismopedia sp. SIO2A8]|nr:long-chain fatty acid--CoA ligase [Merismopedia sp. SIO2A8]
IIIDQPDRYQPACHLSAHDQLALEDREEDELRLLHPWQRQSYPLEWWSLTAVRQIGAVIKTAEGVAQLRDAIHPSDLATIVYISGEQGRPKGVMLSHGAIASNILSAFRVYPNLGTGDTEVALSFLPLTHIFARSFIYGHLAYGHSIYFSSPNRVVRYLKQVQPTIFITVPRFLEKVHSKIIERGQRLRGWQRWVFGWALALAKRYELGKRPQGWYGFQMQLADLFVFTKWRSPFGSRLKALISGGAALSAPVSNMLSAAGLPIQQGYGLTETSGVLCYGRGDWNRAGSVGPPIPGVQLSIADDGEVLVKSPGLMQGYSLNPSYLLPAPQESHPFSDPWLFQVPTDLSPSTPNIDAGGWLHTGDLGRLSDDGSLQITGVKKSMFKLTTGKYISAAALETAVKQSPLVVEAIAVGANRKFCAMLIWPNFNTLKQQVQLMDLHIPPTALMHHPCVMALYQTLVDTANCHLPTWSTVKRFVLMETPLSVGNYHVLEPNQRRPFHELTYLQRAEILAQCSREIDDLYAPIHPQWGQEGELAVSATDCSLPAFTCPVSAQSLVQH